MKGSNHGGEQDLCQKFGSQERSAEWLGLGGTGKLRQQLRGRTLYLDCAEDVGGSFPGLDGNPGLSQEPTGKFGGEVVKYLKREKTMDTEAVEGGSGRAKVDELLARGQSLWHDTLSRALMESGELSGLINDFGIRGITTNPAIFEKAISGSPDYDNEIVQLLGRNFQPEEILRKLMVEDVQRACDLFLPLFRSSGRTDGFVSIEVHPGLAHLSGDSVEEALRLRAVIDRPNLLVKIPGTEEGMTAIRDLISEGVSVNVTLLFSPESYRRSAQAYIEGLESWVGKGKNPAEVTGVASLFVSRIDTAVDRRLERIRVESDDQALSRKAAEIRGKAGIANAQVVYQLFCDIFGDMPFSRLAKRGANLQRPLWASTGTKNPEYSDVLYVEGLIGADTVNTLPLPTFRAFLDHGKVERSIDRYWFDLRADPPQSVFGQLAFLGMDLEEVYRELLREGISGFNQSWTNLVSSLGQKAEKIRRVPKNDPAQTLTLGLPSAEKKEPSPKRERLPFRGGRHLSPSPDGERGEDPKKSRGREPDRRNLSARI